MPLDRLWRRLRWLGLRERELLRWLLLGAWLGLGERLALTTELTGAGVVDDLALCALVLLVAAPLQRLPRPVRVFALSVFALSLTVVVVGDVVHYRYFGAYVNVEDVLLAGQVPAISRSVADLFGLNVVVVGALAPLSLAAWALWASVHYGRRRTRPGLRATTAGALGGLLLASFVAVGHADPAQNNPVLLLTRQAVGMAFGPVGGERVLAELQEGAPAFLPWGEPYRERAEPEHPLLRRVSGGESPPGRPLNVIVILMESVRAFEVGSGIPQAVSVTPNIDRLRREALWFPNHYAVGHQTVRGEGAVLCSLLPNYFGAPTYVRYPSVRTRCLPEILRDHGYSTHWISGFKSTYFNKREFLTGHGVSRIDDMRTVPRSRLTRPKIGWGPSDEDIFAHAVRILDRARRPFFAEVMTLSNHHPFDHAYGLELPRKARSEKEDRLYRDYQKGVHYTDHAIGTFLRAARDRPWYDDTIIVIVGDHGARAFPRRLELRRDAAVVTEMFFRSPLLILTPERRGRRVDVVGSQIDIAPTLLELLGLRADNAFMGVSLLGEPRPGERFAIMAEADAWHIRRGDTYCYALSDSCKEGGVPPCDGGDSVARERTCFRVGGDLLGPRPEERATLLPAVEGAPLLGLGERVVKATQVLIAEDRLYPRRE